MFLPQMHLVPQGYFIRFPRECSSHYFLCNSFKLRFVQQLLLNARHPQSLAPHAPLTVEAEQPNSKGRLEQSNRFDELSSSFQIRWIRLGEVFFPVGDGDNSQQTLNQQFSHITATRTEDLKLLDHQFKGIYQGTKKKYKKRSLGRLKAAVLAIFACRTTIDSVIPIGNHLQAVLENKQVSNII